MLQKQFKLLVFFCFLFISNIHFSQNNSAEYCFHVEQTNNTPQLLQYLFKKYGTEFSETILMNLKAYEVEHDVHVFYKDEYYLLLERIQEIINTSSDQEEIDRLNQKMTKLVLFDNIEAELTH